MENLNRKEIVELVKAKKLPLSVLKPYVEDDEEILLFIRIFLNNIL